VAQTSFQTVDEYIASFPPSVQPILEQVRQSIKAAAPLAREKISYNMPSYEQAGRLLHFSGFKSHVSIFGASGALEAFPKQLAPYAGEKGALRFPYDQPLPLDLIRDIVAFRVKANADQPPR
jgi:uncharacterized protein YdhG (YjbR/CyaY superfamily)